MTARRKDILSAGFAAFTLFWLLISATVGWSRPGERVVALRAGRMLDVKSGKMVRDAVILVRGNRIEAVGTQVKVPAGAKVIDLRNYTVLPGLIDSHTHVCLQPDYGTHNPILYKSIPYRTVEAVRAVKATLEAGFTTIRDVDSEGAEWADVAVRDAIRDGLIPGPRMQVANMAISITAGHMNQTGLAPQIEVPQFAALADTPEQLVYQVRRQIKYGADWIKLYVTGRTSQIDLRTMEPLNQYSYDDIKLVVDEAARFGKPVAVHAYGGQAAKDAVRAGARSVEHGFLMDDETLDLMVQRGTYWVPTLSPYIPDQPREKWSKLSRAIVASHERVFQHALEKGVKIAFGTDAGAFPHGDNAREFVTMVSYGMKPLAAIRSATMVAAELMGLERDIGSITTGKYADIIAVSGNPLQDISALRHVRFVMKGGKIVKQP